MNDFPAHAILKGTNDRPNDPGGVCLETASFLGLGRCDLHDHGHDHGIKLRASKDAKKVYTHAAAAALRMKDSVMGTVTSVQENAADILASAQDINEARAAQEESAAVEDCAEETVSEE